MRFIAATRFLQTPFQWRMFDSSGGLRLANGSLLSVAAALIQEERWQALTPEQRRGFAPLCPALVVELARPSAEVPRSLPALRRKMDLDQANGARQGWLLLPWDRAVESWRGGCPRCGCRWGPRAKASAGLLPRLKADAQRDWLVLEPIRTIEALLAQLDDLRSPDQRRDTPAVIGIDQLEELLADTRPASAQAEPAKGSGFTPSCTRTPGASADAAAGADGPGPCRPPCQPFKALSQAVRSSSFWKSSKASARDSSWLSVRPWIREP